MLDLEKVVLLSLVIWFMLFKVGKIWVEKMYRIILGGVFYILVKVCDGYEIRILFFFFFTL